MEKFVDNIIETDLDNLTKLELPYNEFFGLRITDKESHYKTKYEFLLRLSATNKNLICFGSGAIKRSGEKALSPPIFNRFSWQNKFEESVIYYNDPTLYLSPKLELCWGVGTPDEYYLEKTSKIIKIISDKVGIVRENTLFYGSSGGGFTSIQLATLLRSPALVNNAQIILRNYYQRIFNNMMNVCFEGLDSEEIKTKYEYKLSGIEMFKRENYVPKIIYYVNAGSSADMNNQCIPFISELQKLKFDKYITIKIYENGRGHHPLTNSTSIKIIKETVQELLYNPEGYKGEVYHLKKELEAQKNRKIVRFVDNFNKAKNNLFNKLRSN